jgi:hypothetical protein
MKEGRLYVGYCRVSTDKQGRSGLGLEAQKAGGHAICHALLPRIEVGKRDPRFRA